MENRYYSFPLKAGAFIRKEQHPMAGLPEAIRQHIRVLLITRFNENRYDAAFGNAIWENEFEHIQHNNPLREHVRQSVLQCITRYEYRIEQVKVDIHISQEELHSAQLRRLHEKVDIHISAVIIKTREPFLHHEHFYIAPLAQD